MFFPVAYTPPPPAWPPSTKKQSIGMGLYLVQNFVTPQRLVAPLSSAKIEIPKGWAASAGCPCSKAKGVGCPGKEGCTCGCSGPAGMGLFDSGTDFSGWGWPEWGIVIVAGLAGISLLQNIFQAGKSVGRGYKEVQARRRRKRSLKARKARLQEQLAGL